MHSLKKAAFSPCGKYFACYSSDDKLLVWETLNNVFIDCKFDSRYNTSCSSLQWVTLRHKPPSSRKAKQIKSSSSETHLLGVGTVKGDILLYDVSCENLYLHMAGRHSDAINDMCFHSDSLFTCSSDKSIALWDISNGRQKSKWEAGDDPVTSICVIDENNLLSSSTSIILWNISEKKAIKTFSGHSSEIFKLLPVNAVSLNSCYFLSAAVDDAKINAWSISSNESETPVACFVLSGKVKALDISKEANKDKALLLSVVTEDGYFHRFEHVLNGNVNQPIQPKVHTKVISESPSPSIIHLKVVPDSGSCIIAYGNSKEDFQFQPLVIETNKTEMNVHVNGLKSKCLDSNKKMSHLDSNSYRRKLRSSGIDLTEADSDTLNLSETDDYKSSRRSNNHLKVNMKNPKSSMDSLLKGLHTRNEETINAVFHISDVQIIRKCVENISPNSLTLVLEELNNRLCHHQSCSSTLVKWLKEISTVHLNYIMENEETKKVLQLITNYLDSLKIHKCIAKMSALQGLLSLTTQISSSEESNSDSEELMES